MTDKKSKAKTSTAQQYDVDAARKRIGAKFDQVIQNKASEAKATARAKGKHGLADTVSGMGPTMKEGVNVVKGVAINVTRDLDTEKRGVEAKAADITAVTLGRGPLTGYPEYGLYTADYYQPAADGKYYKNSKCKLFLRGDPADTSKPMQIAGFPGVHYVIYPHQKVIEDVLSIADKGTYKFTQGKIHYGKGDAVMQAEFFSDEIVNIGKGEDFQLGVMVRNGYDGTVGLGGDVFVKRLVCQNGNLGRFSLGSFSIRHVGDKEKLVAEYRQQMPRIIDAGRKWVQAMNEWRLINLNERIARFVIKKARLPKAYWPSYVQEEQVKVESEQEGEKAKVDKIIKLAVSNKDHLSLYDFYNDLNGGEDNKSGVWHSKTLQTQNKSFILRALSGATANVPSMTAALQVTRRSA